jgi:hypothetical protein
MCLRQNWGGVEISPQSRRIKHDYMSQHIKRDYFNHDL